MNYILYFELLKVAICLLAVTCFWCLVFVIPFCMNGGNDLKGLDKTTISNINERSLTRGLTLSLLFLWAMLHFTMSEATHQLVDKSRTIEKECENEISNERSGNCVLELSQIPKNLTSKGVRQALNLPSDVRVIVTPRVGDKEWKEWVEREKARGQIEEIVHELQTLLLIMMKLTEIKSGNSSHNKPKEYFDPSFIRQTKKKAGKWWDRSQKQEGIRFLPSDCRKTKDRVAVMVVPQTEDAEFPQLAVFAECSEQLKPTLASLHAPFSDVSSAVVTSCSSAGSQLENTEIPGKGGNFANNSLSHSDDITSLETPSSSVASNQIRICEHCTSHPSISNSSFDAPSSITTGDSSFLPLSSSSSSLPLSSSRFSSNTIFPAFTTSSSIFSSPTASLKSSLLPHNAKFLSSSLHPSPLHTPSIASSSSPSLSFSPSSSSSSTFYPSNSTSTSKDFPLTAIVFIPLSSSSPLLPCDISVLLPAAHHLNPLHPLRRLRSEVKKLLKNGRGIFAGLVEEEERRRKEEERKMAKGRRENEKEEEGKGKEEEEEEEEEIVQKYEEAINSTRRGYNERYAQKNDEERERRRKAFYPSDISFSNKMFEEEGGGEEEDNENNEESEESEGFNSKENNILSYRSTQNKTHSAKKKKKNNGVAFIHFTSKAELFKFLRAPFTSNSSKQHIFITYQSQSLSSTAISSSTNISSSSHIPTSAPGYESSSSSVPYTRLSLTTEKHKAKQCELSCPPEASMIKWSQKPIDPTTLTLRLLILSVAVFVLCFVWNIPVVALSQLGSSSVLKLIDSIAEATYAAADLYEENFSGGYLEHSSHTNGAGGGEADSLRRGRESERFNKGSKNYFYRLSSNRRKNYPTSTAARQKHNILVVNRKGKIRQPTHTHDSSPAIPPFPQSLSSIYSPPPSPSSQTAQTEHSFSSSLSSSSSSSSSPSLPTRLQPTTSFLYRIGETIASVVSSLLTLALNALLLPILRLFVGRLGFSDKQKEQKTTTLFLCLFVVLNTLFVPAGVSLFGVVTLASSVLDGWKQIALAVVSANRVQMCSLVIAASLVTNGVRLSQAAQMFLVCFMNWKKMLWWTKMGKWARRLRKEQEREREEERREALKVWREQQEEEDRKIKTRKDDDSDGFEVIEKDSSCGEMMKNEDSSESSIEKQANKCSNAHSATIKRFEMQTEGECSPVLAAVPASETSPHLVFSSSSSSSSTTSASVPPSSPSSINSTNLHSTTSPNSSSPPPLYSLPSPQPSSAIPIERSVADIVLMLSVSLILVSHAPILSFLSLFFCIVRFFVDRYILFHLLQAQVEKEKRTEKARELWCKNTHKRDKSNDNNNDDDDDNHNNNKNGTFSSSSSTTTTSSIPPSVDSSNLIHSSASSFPDHPRHSPSPDSSCTALSTTATTTTTTASTSSSLFVSPPMHSTLTIPIVSDPFVSPYSYSARSSPTTLKTANYSFFYTILSVFSFIILFSSLVFCGYITATGDVLFGILCGFGALFFYFVSMLRTSQVRRTNDEKAFCDLVTEHSEDEQRVHTHQHCSTFQAICQIFSQSTLSFTEFHRSQGDNEIYVDETSGQDENNCYVASESCKTMKHAADLASQNSIHSIAIVQSASIVEDISINKGPLTIKSNGIVELLKFHQNGCITFTPTEESLLLSFSNLHIVINEEVSSKSSCVIIIKGTMQLSSCIVDSTGTQQITKDFVIASGGILQIQSSNISNISFGSFLFANVSSGSEIIITNSSISSVTGNEALIMINDESLLKINSSSFSNVTIETGSMLNCDICSTVTLENSSRFNTITSRSGSGSVVSWKGDLQQKGKKFIIQAECSFINCSAIYGGAVWIHLERKSSVKFEKVYFTNCKAIKSGGAVFIELPSDEQQSDYLIKDVTFTGNKANGDGLQGTEGFGDSVFVNGVDLHSQIIADKWTGSFSSNTTKSSFCGKEEEEEEVHSLLPFLFRLNASADETWNVNVDGTQGYDHLCCGSAVTPCISIKSALSSVQFSTSGDSPKIEVHLVAGIVRESETIKVNKINMTICGISGQQQRCILRNEETLKKNVMEITQNGIVQLTDLTIEMNDTTSFQTTSNSDESTLSYFIVSDTSSLTLHCCYVTQNGPTLNRRFVLVEGGSLNFDELSLNSIAIVPNSEATSTNFAGWITFASSSSSFSITNCSMENITTLSNSETHHSFSFLSHLNGASFLCKNSVFSSFTLSSSSSSSSSSTSYSLLDITHPSSAIFNNASFSNIHSSATNGAAISVSIQQNEKFSLRDCLFEHCELNSSNGKGGAVYLCLTGTGSSFDYSITNVSFESNKAAYGIDLFVDGVLFEQTIQSDKWLRSFSESTPLTSFWGVDRADSDDQEHGTSLLYYLLRPFNKIVVTTQLLNNPSSSLLTVHTPNDHPLCGHESLPCATLNFAHSRLSQNISTIHIVRSCVVDDAVSFTSQPVSFTSSMSSLSTSSSSSSHHSKANQQTSLPMIIVHPNGTFIIPSTLSLQYQFTLTSFSFSLPSSHSSSVTSLFVISSGNTTLSSCLFTSPSANPFVTSLPIAAVSKGSLNIISTTISLLTFRDCQSVFSINGDGVCRFDLSYIRNISVSSGSFVKTTQSASVSAYYSSASFVNFPEGSFIDSSTGAFSIEFTFSNFSDASTKNSCGSILQSTVLAGSCVNVNSSCKFLRCSSLSQAEQPDSSSSGGGGALKVTLSSSSSHFEIKQSTFSECQAPNGCGGGINLHLKGESETFDYSFSTVSFISCSALKGTNIFVRAHMLNKSIDETKFKNLFTINSNKAELWGFDESSNEDFSLIYYFFHASPDLLFVDNERGEDIPVCGHYFFPCRSIQFVASLNFISVNVSLDSQTFKEGNAVVNESNSVNLIGQSQILSHIVSDELCGQSIFSVGEGTLSATNLSFIVESGPFDSAGAFIVLNGNGNVTLTECSVKQLSVANPASRSFLEASHGSVSFTNVIIAGIVHTGDSFISLTGDAAFSASNCGIDSITIADEEPSIFIELNTSSNIIVCNTNFTLLSGATEDSCILMVASPSSPSDQFSTAQFSSVRFLGSANYSTSFSGDLLRIVNRNDVTVTDCSFRFLVGANPSHAISISDNSAVTISKTSFSSLKGSSNGCAIRIATSFGASCTQLDSSQHENNERGCTVSIDECTFIKCIVTRMIDVAEMGCGGAVWIGFAKSITISRSVFSQCCAEEGSALTSFTAFGTRGGAIATEAVEDIRISDCSFADCSSTGAGAAVSSLHGTNVSILGCNISSCYIQRSISSEEIEEKMILASKTYANSENISETGGGAIWTSSETFTLNRCYFNNIISSFDGSALHISGRCTAKIDDCSASSCSARKGGVIFVDIHSTSVTINNFTITLCSATDKGGAVYLTATQGSTFICNQCNFTSCSASDGGAFYLLTPRTSQLTSLSFISCSSQVNGGSITINSDTSTSETYINQCTFRGNSVDGAGGNDIFDLSTNGGKFWTSANVIESSSQSNPIMFASASWDILDCLLNEACGTSSIVFVRPILGKDESACGSVEKPCKTIPYAVKNAGALASVICYPGTHNINNAKTENPTSAGAVVVGCNDFAFYGISRETTTGEATYDNSSNNSGDCDIVFLITSGKMLAVKFTFIHTTPSYTSNNKMQKYNGDDSSFFAVTEGGSLLFQKCFFTQKQSHALSTPFIIIYARGTLEITQSSHFQSLSFAHCPAIQTINAKSVKIDKASFNSISSTSLKGGAIYAVLSMNDHFAVSNSLFEKCSVPKIDLNSSSDNDQNAEGGNGGAIYLTLQGEKESYSFSFLRVSFSLNEATLGPDVFIEGAFFASIIDPNAWEGTFSTTTPDGTLWGVDIDATVNSSTSLKYFLLQPEDAVYVDSSKDNHRTCGHQCLPCKTAQYAFARLSDTRRTIRIVETTSLGKSIDFAGVATAILADGELSSLEVQTDAQIINHPPNWSDSIISFTNIFFKISAEASTVITSLFLVDGGKMQFESCRFGDSLEVPIPLNVFQISSAEVKISRGSLHNAQFAESSSFIKASDSSIVKMEQFTASEVSVSGGASIIEAEDGATMELTETTFTSCNVSTGSVVRCNKVLSTAIKSTTSFSSIKTEGNGGALHATVESRDQIFINNSVVFSDCQSEKGNGGAMYISVSGTGLLALDGVQIRGCSALEGNGGGMYVFLFGDERDYDVNVKSVTFLNNHAIQGTDVFVDGIYFSTVITTTRWRNSYSETTKRISFWGIDRSLTEETNSSTSLLYYLLRPSTTIFANSSDDNHILCGYRVLHCKTVQYAHSRMTSYINSVTIVGESELSEPIQLNGLTTSFVSSSNAYGTIKVRNGGCFINEAATSNRNSITFSIIKFLLPNETTEPNTELMLSSGSKIVIKNCFYSAEESETNLKLIQATGGEVQMTSCSVDSISFINSANIIQASGNATITLTRISVYGNSIQGNCGLIEIGVESTLSIISSTFAQCNVHEGCIVKANKAQKVNISEPTSFVGISGENNGVAIFAAIESGQCLYVEGNVTFTNCINSNGNGGAIYVRLGGSGTLSLNRCEQKECEAREGNGGGIYLEFDKSEKDVDYSLKNLVFLGNKALLGADVFVKGGSFEDTIEETKWSGSFSIATGRNSLWGVDELRSESENSSSSLLYYLFRAQDVIYVNSEEDNHIMCGHILLACKSISYSFNRLTNEHRTITIKDKGLLDEVASVNGEELTINSYSYRLSTVNVRYNGAISNMAVTPSNNVVMFQSLLFDFELEERENPILLQNSNVMKLISCQIGGEIQITQCTFVNLQITSTNPLFDISSTASFTMNQVTIEDISITQSCCVVRCSDGATFIMAGSSFSRCGGENASMISSERSSSIRIVEPSSFTDINGKNGGAVLRANIESDQSITIEGRVQFTKCSCENGNGGAISCSLSGTASLLLSRCSFTSCSSPKGNGGAIYLELNGAEVIYSLHYLTFSTNTGVFGNDVYIKGSSFDEVIVDSRWTGSYSLLTPREAFCGIDLSITEDDNSSASLLYYLFRPSDKVYSSSNDTNHAMCGHFILPCKSIPFSLTRLAVQRQTIIVKENGLINDFAEIAGRNLTITSESDSSTITVTNNGKITNIATVRDSQLVNISSVQFILPTFSSSQLSNKYDQMLSTDETPKAMIESNGGIISITSSSIIQNEVDASTDFSLILITGGSFEFYYSSIQSLRLTLLNSFILSKGSSSILLDHLIVSQIDLSGSASFIESGISSSTSITETAFDQIILDENSIIRTDRANDLNISAPVTFFNIISSKGSCAIRSNIGNENKVMINGSVAFQNCSSSDGDGGALSFNLYKGGILNMVGCQIIECKALNGVGGGVFLQLDQSERIASYLFQSVAFSNNQATLGSDVYLDGAYFDSTVVESSWIGSYSLHQIDNLWGIDRTLTPEQNASTSLLYYLYKPSEVIYMSSLFENHIRCGHLQLPCKSLEYSLKHSLPSKQTIKIQDQGSLQDIAAINGASCAVSGLSSTARLNISDKGCITNYVLGSSDEQSIAFSEIEFLLPSTSSVSSIISSNAGTLSVTSSIFEQNSLDLPFSATIITLSGAGKLLLKSTSLITISLGQNSPFIDATGSSIAECAQLTVENVSSSSAKGVIVFSMGTTLSVIESTFKNITLSNSCVIGSEKARNITIKTVTKFANISSTLNATICCSIGNSDSVTIEDNVTFTKCINQHGNGGSISSTIVGNGSLSVIECALEECEAREGNGGGIYLEFDKSEKDVDYSLKNLVFLGNKALLGADVFVKGGSFEDTIEETKWSGSFSIATGRNSLWGVDELRSESENSSSSLLYYLFRAQDVIYVNSEEDNHIMCGHILLACKSISYSFNRLTNEHRTVLLRGSGHLDELAILTDTTTTVKSSDNQLSTVIISSLAGISLLTTPQKESSIFFEKLSFSVPEISTRKVLLAIDGGNASLNSCDFSASSPQNICPFSLISVSKGNLNIEKVIISLMNVEESRNIISLVEESSITINQASLSSLSFKKTSSAISLGPECELSVLESSFKECKMENGSLIKTDYAASITIYSHSTFNQIESKGEGSVLSAIIGKSCNLSVDGGCEFTSCGSTESNGGCIHISVENNGSFSLSDITFSSCYSTKGKGGAIYLSLLGEQSNYTYSLRSVTFRMGNAEFGADLYLDGPNLASHIEEVRFTDSFSLENSERLWSFDRVTNVSCSVIDYFTKIGTTIYSSSITGRDAPLCGSASVPCFSLHHGFTQAVSRLLTNVAVVTESFISETIHITGTMSISTYNNQLLSQYSSRNEEESKEAILHLRDSTNVEADVYGLITNDGSLAFSRLNFTLPSSLTYLSSLFVSRGALLSFTTSNFSPLQVGVSSTSPSLFDVRIGTLTLSDVSFEQISFAENDFLLKLNDMSTSTFTAVSFSALRIGGNLIHVNSGCTLEMMRCSSSSFISLSKHLIETSNASKVEIRSSTFSQIASANGNGAIIHLCVDTGCSVIVNESDFSTISTQDGDGGALHATVSGSGSFYLNNGTLSDCSAPSTKGRGGAIFLQLNSESSCDYLFHGTIFSGNTAFCGRDVFVHSFNLEATIHQSAFNFSFDSPFERNNSLYGIDENEYPSNTDLFLFLLEYHNEIVYVKTENRRDSFMCGRPASPCKTLEFGVTHLSGSFSTIAINNSVSVSTSINATGITFKPSQLSEPLRASNEEQNYDDSIMSNEFVDTASIVIAAPSNKTLLQPLISNEGVCFIAYIKFSLSSESSSSLPQMPSVIGSSGERLTLNHLSFIKATSPIKCALISASKGAMTMQSVCVSFISAETLFGIIQLSLGTTIKVNDSSFENLVSIDSPVIQIVSSNSQNLSNNDTSSNSSDQKQNLRANEITTITVLNTKFSAIERANGRGPSVMSQIASSASSDTNFDSQSSITFKKCSFITCQTMSKLSSSSVFDLVGGKKSEQSNEEETLLPQFILEECSFEDCRSLLQPVSYGMIASFTLFDISINLCTFNGKQLPVNSLSLSNEEMDVPCGWSSSQIHLKECIALLKSTEISYSAQGALSISGGDVQLSDIFFTGNNPEIPLFPSARRNIHCENEGRLNVESLKNVVINKQAASSELPSLWIDSKNCTLTGILEDFPSPLFVPRLESIQFTSYGAESDIAFTGSMLMPCTMHFELFLAANATSQASSNGQSSNGEISNIIFESMNVVNESYATATIETSKLGDSSVQWRGRLLFLDHKGEWKKTNDLIVRDKMEKLSETKEPFNISTILPYLIALCVLLLILVVVVIVMRKRNSKTKSMSIATWTEEDKTAVQQALLVDDEEEELEAAINDRENEGDDVTSVHIIPLGPESPSSADLYPSSASSNSFEDSPSSSSGSSASPSIMRNGEKNIEMTPIPLGTENEKIMSLADSISSNKSHSLSPASLKKSPIHGKRGFSKMESTGTDFISSPICGSSMSSSSSSASHSPLSQKMERIRQSSTFSSPQTSPLVVCRPSNRHIKPASRESPQQSPNVPHFEIKPKAEQPVEISQFLDQFMNDVDNNQQNIVDISHHNGSHSRSSSIITSALSSPMQSTFSSPISASMLADSVIGSACPSPQTPYPQPFSTIVTSNPSTPMQSLQTPQASSLSTSSTIQSPMPTVFGRIGQQSQLSQSTLSQCNPQDSRQTMIDSPYNSQLSSQIPSSTSSPANASALRFSDTSHFTPVTPRTSIASQATPIKPIQAPISASNLVEQGPPVRGRGKQIPPLVIPQTSNEQMEVSHDGNLEQIQTDNSNVSTEDEQKLGKRTNPMSMQKQNAEKNKAQSSSQQPQKRPRKKQSRLDDLSEFGDFAPVPKTPVREYKCSSQLSTPVIQPVYAKPPPQPVSPGFALSPRASVSHSFNPAEEEYTTQLPPLSPNSSSVIAPSFYHKAEAKSAAAVEPPKPVPPLARQSSAVALIASRPRRRKPT
ncbi:uncharacterized protein MONOS_5695 [Monocercomonoides exilis]|uniref:uncharacterized protein n=1 Tax=Monocercomonoides exilis TaxID=2049356 RepID=UPI00355958E9|nr:hypothetical protein MONOS_5695 [Monocercomonoides exilis]|eukprot:MONOS_5695.1-p1 / transcript=MONOS_5695.1 / gene=MONOS_5695 / organism=Monocercomonoides_exilis_PA203 / gene_product=unspecified product / transcript_product=unspecified product / location=Mono_scaffold00169:34610-59088(+) / protein_length=7886 / sequence_SO=supercontig / SO=protein_coding / is_pseudo=false